MNFSFIDILCVAFLLICAIFGYRKGFIVQLYDIISFLLVLFLVYLLSEPLASIWTIYSYDQSDFIASMIGHMINRLLVGFILFLLFMATLLIKSIQIRQYDHLPLIIFGFIFLLAYKTGGVLTYLLMWYLFSVMISLIDLKLYERQDYNVVDWVESNKNGL